MQPFNQQGLEKFNDVVTKNFFRSSCHRGDVALRQLVEKQNRLEHLQNNGDKRLKVFDMCCSNCQSKGHNRLTCSMACKECGTSPYYQHLELADGRRVPTCLKEN